MKDLNNILQTFLKDSLTKGKGVPLIRQGIRRMAIEEIKGWALRIYDHSQEKYLLKETTGSHRQVFRQVIEKAIECLCRCHLDSGKCNCSICKDDLNECKHCTKTDEEEASLGTPTTKSRI